MDLNGLSRRPAPTAVRGVANRSRIGTEMRHREGDVALSVHPRHTFARRRLPIPILPGFCENASLSLQKSGSSPAYESVQEVVTRHLESLSNKIDLYSQKGRRDAISH